MPEFEQESGMHQVPAGRVATHQGMQRPGHAGQGALAACCEAEQACVSSRKGKGSRAWVRVGERESCAWSRRRRAVHWRALSRSSTMGSAERPGAPQSGSLSQIASSSASSRRSVRHAARRSARVSPSTSASQSDDTGDAIVAASTSNGYEPALAIAEPATLAHDLHGSARTAAVRSSRSARSTSQPARSARQPDRVVSRSAR